MVAHSSRWQLQEAKNKLSEVVRRARQEGPQTITVHGEDAVTVARASPNARPAEFQESLWEFFQRSPAAGIDFEVPHLHDIPGRDVALLFEDDED